MFDGVPDQFHQFIASRTSLPLPLSFPLHGSSPTFPSFDPYPSHHHNQTVLQQSHFLQQLHHHQSPAHKDEEKEENSLLSTNLEPERERSIPMLVDPWSNDEVLALLRIRSSMENWFPDFTWEYVSRKLAEFGFKRSAEKCKEKFEEESRHFNSISYNKNYRFFSELEELYHGENPEVLSEKNQNDHVEKPNEEEDKMGGQSLEAEDSRNEKEVGKSKGKKRKRREKFEMLKGFCEEIVNKMMAQQEELHNKLIEDMVKREEEKIAREEAWKKQEMDRINKEIEIRAHEQAIASDRQSTIIEFLKKFTSNSSEFEDLLKVPNTSNSPTSSSLSTLPQNPNSTCQLSNQQDKLETMVVTQQNPTSLPTQNNPNVPTSLLTETLAPQNPSSSSTIATNVLEVPTSSTLALASQNPNSTNTQDNPSTPKPSRNPNFAVANERDDAGKRWPRDEVLALINLRCSLYSSGEDHKEGAKGPLWERISQGMLELGHKRSAKRCKEKWENINKYFRKTKDVNKKRSLDSRTCPYFHQLSSLYSQGTLVAAPPVGVPENCSAGQETTLGSPQGGSSSTDANGHVAEGGKSITQLPAAFEF
uniref:Putative trihelix transcription factor GTL2 n=1 Tax=Davidia involucrata TaxID=16924 RepID=A0A5B7BPK4_DAVIN